MLKDMARQAEEVEQDLVVDCVKHLGLFSRLFNYNFLFV